MLAPVRKTWPRMLHVFADVGYADSKLEGALAEAGQWTLETAKGFELLPRHWVVERTGSG